MKKIDEIRALSKKWVEETQAFESCIRGVADFKIGLRPSVRRGQKVAYVVCSDDSYDNVRHFRELFWTLDEAMKFAKQIAWEINYHVNYVEFIWEENPENNYGVLRDEGFDHTDVVVVVCTDNGVLQPKETVVSLYGYAYGHHKGDRSRFPDVQ
jgi:hypothetical protein